MRYHRVTVNSIAAALPPEVITSAEIERRLVPVYGRLGLPEGRLEMMTGIRERRMWPAGKLPSEAAAEAGMKALTAANVNPDEIDSLMYCAVSRDFTEPATSTAVHHRLGLPSRAVNFDISNACLGVLSGMVETANMIELGQVRRGLVVAGENARPLLESTIRELNRDDELTRRTIKPLFASLTIGSGAAAVLLSDAATADAAAGGGMRLLGGAHLCDTAHAELCRGDSSPGTGKDAQALMQTDSTELLVQGINVARDTWELAKKELGWDNSTPNVTCTHQVGRVHREKFYDALELDPKKDFATVEHLGNCGSASLPMTVAAALEQGRLPKGGRLAMLGIGSGINCMMLGLRA